MLRVLFVLFADKDNQLTSVLACQAIGVSLFVIISTVCSKVCSVAKLLKANDG